MFAFSMIMLELVYHKFIKFTERGLVMINSSNSFRRERGFHKFVFSFLWYFYFMHFICIPNAFTQQKQDNNSIAVIYIETLSNTVVDPEGTYAGNESKMYMRLSTDQVAVFELGKKILKETEEPFGIEYTHALAQNPISDTRSYKKLRYRNGYIVYFADIPPGKFNINKIILPSMQANYKVYRRWINTEKATRNILPASVSFLGSYRVHSNTYNEERYGSNGEIKIVTHSGILSDIYDPTDNIDFNPIMKPCEEEILRWLVPTIRGKWRKQILQDRLDEIEKNRTKGILGIDHESNVDHDSIIKHHIGILGGGENIKTEEIQLAMDVLDWYGPLSMDHLLNVFDSKDKTDNHNINNITRRLNTITVLAKIGDKRAVEPLKKIIESEALVEQEREAAEKALKNITEQRILYNRLGIKHFYDQEEFVVYALSTRLSDYENKSIDFLMKALESYNPEVRIDALAALMKNKYIVDTDIFVQFLKNENEDVRLNTSALLSSQKEKSCIPALIEALDDSSSFVKMNSIKGLIAIGNSGMISQIEKLKDDPDELVRNSVNTAISFLQKQ